MFLLAAAVALAIPNAAAAPAAVADVAVSTSAARKSPPIEFHFDKTAPNRERGRETIGVSGGLMEGKPLEVLVWGSGGAIAGSLAGPIGAAIGGGVGALCGLVYSKFVVPRNGPQN